VFWGLYHGLFLILERRWLKDVLQRTPRAVRHAYLLLVVLVGWSLFRAESVGDACALVGAMAGFGAGDGIRQSVGLHLSNQGALALAAGVFLSLPWIPWLRGRWAEKSSEATVPRVPVLIHAFGVATQALLLWLCLLQMAGGTQNPFIYFRF
jgi:alginate O-acetyltransferase complex protein AlgI